MLYTWPVFSGHISPVPASNSWASWKPYFGPSLSSASNAWRTIIDRALLGVPRGMFSVLFAVHYSVHYS